ncbi:MAG: YjgP/YjgQ family permease [Planctomycetes bacterium]|nr:YjgP/YjgQ family permease [Planctomycetota bacterium]
MRLLQRYILAELLRVFVFVLGILTVLLGFLGVFQQITERGLGPLQVVQVLPYLIPSLVPYTIPATLLLSVCVVYGRMAGDQEITAAKAAGINVLSLLAPSLFLGGVLSVGSLLLTDQVIPWAESKIKHIVAAGMKDIVLDMLRSQNQMTIDGYSISVRDVGPDGKLIRPTFRFAPKGMHRLTAQAQEAELTRFDLEKQQVLVRFSRVQLDVPGQGRSWAEEFEHYFPLQIGNRAPKARHINVRELHNELDSLEAQHQDLQCRREIEAAFALATGDFKVLQDGLLTQLDNRLRRNRKLYNDQRTEVQFRFAMACSCFFFVLVGSPYAVLQAKRQFLTNFMVCFLPILLGYYPLVLLARNLSNMGTANPVWAIWSANILVMIVGLFLLRRVNQH